MIEILKEMKLKGFDIYSDVPRVYCKAFEDNSGALEMARLPKMRPRTRHVNQVYHHFRDHVRRREVSIWPVETAQQLADILTKPLPPGQFVYLRKKLLNW